jgi:O-antigen/teichoic acid export membrane protein
MGMALITCFLANCVLQLGSSQILGLFGHTYAEEASWSLRILSLAAFPFIIKSLYIAICRIENRLMGAMLLLTACGLLELVSVAIGGRLAGLIGLSLGWLIAACIETIFMFSTVYKVIRFTGTQQDASTQAATQPDYVEQNLLISAMSKRQDS